MGSQKLNEINFHQVLKDIESKLSQEDAFILLNLMQEKEDLKTRYLEAENKLILKILSLLN